MKTGLEAVNQQFVGATFHWPNVNRLLLPESAGGESLISPRNSALAEEFTRALGEFADELLALSDRVYTQKILGSTIAAQTRHVIKRVEYLAFNVEVGEAIPAERPRMSRILLPGEPAPRDFFMDGASREILRNKSAAVSALEGLQVRLFLLNFVDLDRQLNIEQQTRSPITPVFRTGTSLGHEAFAVLKHTVHHAALIRKMLTSVGMQPHSKLFGLATSTVVRMIERLEPNGDSQAVRR